MQEIWKNINNYNNEYAVSNLGNVRRNDSYNYKGYHFKERILSQQIDRLGYCRVYLTKYSKTKVFLVHRLVAQAFIPNPHNLPEVNHKDENKLNNAVENLEWCTHIYNSNYGTRVSRIIPKTIAKTRKKIYQLSLNGDVINLWDGVNIAAKTLGITQQNITKCYQGLRRQAGGYKWKLAEQMKEGDLVGEDIRKF